MKTTFVKLRNLLILGIIAGFFACEGPEGPIGPAGPKGDTGPQGVAGPTGPAGQDGEDGQDGQDGEDGQDGQDGNANVTVLSLLSTDITWLEGEYLGRPASIFSLTSSAINDDIINHGTVLAYCNIDGGWFILPFSWEAIDGMTRMYLLHSYSPNTITLYSYMSTGALEPDPRIITEYRFMLITDNTVTGAKGISAENDILMKLEKAGVNIDNYYEVMDYFGLKY